MKHRHCIAIVVSFVLLLYCIAIAFWGIPDKSFSEQENRALQTLPRLDAEKLFSGELASLYNDYFADQFPLRNTLVAVKGTLELISGKGENNGILFGKNGQLAKRLFSMARADGEAATDSDVVDLVHLQNAARGINRAAQNADVPFLALLTGRTVDVASSAFFYPSDSSNAMLETLRQSVEGDVVYLDIVPDYRARYENGEYVYYRTDHHWTTLGAYYAYEETMKAMGRAEEILPMDAFERKPVSTDFYGSLWSAAGMRWVSPDAVEFWVRGNEEAFSVVADGRELDGFYNTKWLSKKDHYSAFLDGTHDVVTITRKDGAPRERLLIIKDSFANALAPFLAQHFDLVLLNLSSTRQDYTNVSALAREYDADAVMLVYTIENLLTADKLCRLK